MRRLADADRPRDREKEKKTNDDEMPFVWFSLFSIPSRVLNGDGFSSLSGGGYSIIRTRKWERATSASCIMRIHVLASSNLTASRAALYAGPAIVNNCNKSLKTSLSFVC